MQIRHSLLPPALPEFWGHWTRDWKIVRSVPRSFGQGVFVFGGHVHVDYLPLISVGGRTGTGTSKVAEKFDVRGQGVQSQQTPRDTAEAVAVIKMVKATQKKSLGKGETGKVFDTPV